MIVTFFYPIVLFKHNYLYNNNNKKQRLFSLLWKEDRGIGWQSGKYPRHSDCELKILNHQTCFDSTPPCCPIIICMSVCSKIWKNIPRVLFWFSQIGARNGPGGQHGIRCSTAKPYDTRQRRRRDVFAKSLPTTAATVSSRCPYLPIFFGFKATVSGNRSFFDVK